MSIGETDSRMPPLSPFFKDGCCKLSEMAGDTRVVDPGYVVESLEVVSVAPVYPQDANNSSILTIPNKSADDIFRSGRVVEKWPCVCFTSVREMGGLATDMGAGTLVRAKAGACATNS